MKGWPGLQWMCPCIHWIRWRLGCNPGRGRLAGSDEWLWYIKGYPWCGCSGGSVCLEHLKHVETMRPPSFRLHCPTFWSRNLSKFWSLLSSHFFVCFVSCSGTHSSSRTMLGSSFWGFGQQVAIATFGAGCLAGKSATLFVGAKRFGRPSWKGTWLENTKWPNGAFLNMLWLPKVVKRTQVECRFGGVFAWQCARSPVPWNWCGPKKEYPLVI